MTSSRGRVRALYRKALEALPVGLQRRWLFLRHRRRLLRLEHPLTFSEKVNWRIVHDRRPEIAVAGDKDAAKAYAVTRGVKAARTLWRGTDVRELASSWPFPADQEWVLKPNFSSGDLLFGVGPPGGEACSAAAGWLSSDRSRVGEWAYGQADRVILLEERLGPPGSTMTDYKFFVFDGEVVTAYAAEETTRRLTGSRYYNPDGSPSPYFNPAIPRADVRPLPRSWAAMVRTASSLGHGWDFVRVDLYDVEGEVYFGELTLYPGGGLKPVCPAMDIELGRRWTLPLLN